MRILFSGTPAYGHLLPLLPLEKAARRAGHTTALLTHPSMAEVVAPVPVLPAGPTLEAVFAEVHRRIGANAAEDMSPQTAAEFFGGSRVDLGAEEALAAAADFAPDLIVAESADFLGPLAAAALSVPWVSHGVGIAIEAPLADAMRAAAALRMSERGIAPSEPIASVDPWPAILQRHTWKASGDRISVRPEPHEAEGHADWSPPRFPGREQLPRVLVTLGTIVDDTELLAAVVKSVTAHEVNVIVAVNPSAETDQLSVDPRQVHLAGFVPMARLLEGVDVVVSAAGAGTVLAALSSALPMVLLPMGLDKPLNAERAAAVGAAAVVHHANDVGEAVARVLSDPSFRAAAAMTAERIALMNTADDVLAQLLERMP